MTTSALRPIVAILLSACLTPFASGAEPSPGAEPAAGKAGSPIAWKKTKLSSKFYGEGAHFGRELAHGALDTLP